MNFVQSESLPKLLCCKCNKYLSQFPIHTASHGSTCGRCEPLDGALHNEVYESIAERQQFPCTYNSNGCLENCFPKNIAQHERLCSYRVIDCPTNATTSCQWKGFRDLLQHFEDKHPTFLLNEGDFELDFVNSHEENYLLPYADGLYIVKRAYDSKAGVFSCTVKYEGADAAMEEYFCKIVLKSGRGVHTHELCGKLGDSLVIDKKSINDILKDPLSILARLEIFKKEIQIEEDKKDVDSSIQWDFLRELECLICMEYMVPPIYQCLTGHSVCSTCRPKLKECPTCKGEIANTQNFALAQLVQLIDYPCKNDMCKFKAKPSEIKKHEACCTFNLVPCPLKAFLKCEAKVMLNKMYEHCRQEHYECLLESDSVCIPFDADEAVEEYYFLKYDEKLFGLWYTYHNDNFWWGMKMFGSFEESSQYYFDIDLVDSTGRGNRAYFRKSCVSSFFIEDEDFGIAWETFEIKELITDVLKYRVHIHKFKM